MGQNIISGYGDPEDISNLFYKDSGTSMAASVVSSLCTLVAQKYPHMKASEIVAKIKANAIKFGDPRYTGCGYIWVPSVLDLTTV